MRSLRSFVSAGLLLAGWMAGALSQTPAKAHHELRVWGYKGLAGQILLWEKAYSAEHPEVSFHNELHSPAAVMAGMYNGVADVVVMGREVWHNDTMAYHWIYQQRPFGLVVATAGVDAPGQSASPVVLVNAANPMKTITLAQLDAIYGSEHRAAPANIRTWGELGATGEWADKPIHAWGYGPEDALGVWFRQQVLKSDFKPNPESHLLSDRDPGEGLVAGRIVKAVADDRYAIGYVPGSRLGDGVRMLSVAGGKGEAEMPDLAGLRSHRYPLTREISVYVRRLPAKPLDAEVDGFVRFLLSPMGQVQITPVDGLLPLMPAMVARQLEKLNAPLPPDTPLAGDE